MTDIESLREAAGDLREAAWNNKALMPPFVSEPLADLLDALADLAEQTGDAIPLEARRVADAIRDK